VKPKFGESDGGYGGTRISWSGRPTQGRRKETAEKKNRGGRLNERVLGGREGDHAHHVYHTRRKPSSHSNRRKRVGVGSRAQ